MRYDTATNEQLWMIIKYDYKDCPLSLLRGAALELLNRNQFDKLIADAIRKTINTEVVERKHKVSAEDFMQIGRMEIFKTLNRFKPGKGNSLTSFLYMTVKHEIIKQITNLQAIKRDTRQTVSMSKKLKDNKEYEIFLYDKAVDVEMFVVNKVTIEQLLKRVNKHQRTVLYYHLQGYTFREISKILGRGNFKSMHQAVRLAIEKMRKGA